METIIDFIGNLTHSAGPAVGRPFILREAAQMIVEAGIIELGQIISGNGSNQTGQTP